MQTSIRTWGNSQGLCIPKDMLRQLGWTNQEDVEISISGEKIIIEKIRPKSAKEKAFNQIKALRKTADDFSAQTELIEYLEDRYETE